MPAILTRAKTLRHFYERDYLTMHPDLDVGDVQLKFEALRGLIDQTLTRNPGRIKQVFEIGCGSGTLLQRVSDHVKAQGIGVDISASILAQAKRMTTGLSFVQANAERLPLALERCDLVLFADLVEHVPHPKQFLEGLRSAKQIVMLVPLESGWIADAIHYYRRLVGKPTTRETCGHLHRWNRGTALRLIRSAGLRLLAFEVRKWKWTQYTTWRGRLYGDLSKTLYRAWPWLHQRLFGGYALLALCRADRGD